MLSRWNRTMLNAWDYVYTGGWDSKIPFGSIFFAYAFVGAGLGAVIGAVVGNWGGGLLIGIGWLAGTVVAFAWLAILLRRAPRGRRSQGMY